jgi:hypothetical protein
MHKQQSAKTMRTLLQLHMLRFARLVFELTVETQQLLELTIETLHMPYH